MKAAYDWWPQWGDYRITRIDADDMHITRAEAMQRLQKELQKLWLLEHHEGTMQ